MTETEKALLEEFLKSSELTRIVQGAVLDFTKQLGQHNWQDLVFDIELPEERQNYASSNPGVVLPITHTSDPIRHAELCEQLTWGKQPWFMSVYGLACLRTNEVGQYVLDDVNFVTLEHDQAAMLEVFRNAKESAQNTTTGQATRTKTRKVIAKPTRRSTKSATKKSSRKR